MASTGGDAVIGNWAGWGLWLAPNGTAWTLLAPAVPALVLMPFVFGRLEKTLQGELLVVLAIAGFALPVAYSGGLSLTKAAAMTAVWATALTVATVAVRRVTASAKSVMTPMKVIAPILVALALQGALVCLVLAGRFPLAVVARVPERIEVVIAIDCDDVLALARRAWLTAIFAF